MLWFILGLIIGSGLLVLIYWIRTRKIVVKWYEWLLGVIGLLLLLFMIQNILGSVRELEPTAAWQFLWLIGLPAIIFTALAVWLPMRRYRKTGSGN
ncbi:dehalogenase [Chloroflexota bacterium]